MRIIRGLFSFKTTIVLFVLLGLGAGWATFLEKDFGTSSAKIVVYNSLWYEILFILAILNLIGIIFKFKMWKRFPKFIFHIAFIVILIGAFITRYYGYEGVMMIPEGEKTNKITTFESYFKIDVENQDEKQHYEFKKDFTKTFLFLNNFSYKFSILNKAKEIKKFELSLESYKILENNRKIKLNLKSMSNNKDYKITIDKKLNISNEPILVKVDDIDMYISYGPKELYLPFFIKLKDFQLERYPGSMAPSSYVSEITVIKPDNKKYDYRIFMNNTLKEGAYLFFQSSYFRDEKGTILSVNKDPGKWPTYFGYFLLFLGLILNFFDKKSRFLELAKALSKKSIVFIGLVCFVCFGNVELKAQDALEKTNMIDMKLYLQTYKDDSKETADKFSRLVVQASDGRMEPVSTLNLNIVRKITGRNSIYNMNSDQIALGMLARPDIWAKVKLIKIKTYKIKKVLNINKNEKYISFSEVFSKKDGSYLLGKDTENAMNKKASQRDTYDRELIKINEKIGIMYEVFNGGGFYNIFPRAKAAKITMDDNNKWYTPIQAGRYFMTKSKCGNVRAMITNLLTYVSEFQWSEANQVISEIKSYQSLEGSEVMISDSDINSEVLFNKINIFFKLTLVYIILGFVMLISSFVSLFKPKIFNKKIVFMFFLLISFAFIAHTFGMIFRWMISGHAPWSNTYESMLYISWSAVFAGVVFFRKSFLALSASIIMAGIFMFTAHLTGIDPKITNLVPVLKSYWLTIHVSVLTASYGFFGLSSILGFMTLIMIIIRKNRDYLEEKIKEISIINEMSLIIGLTALVIGNFMGGIWANESWGRYWGWDPKETWSYVSIIVYAFVLHLRFVKKFNNPFVFASASFLAFSTVLMTYFGVNFYLSGMHSYASGDPLPISNWLYGVLFGIMIVEIFAYKNKNLIFKK